jgi:hypothetical protein
MRHNSHYQTYQTVYIRAGGLPPRKRIEMSHICDLPHSSTGWRVDPDEQCRGFAVWHDGILVFQTPCGCDQCRDHAYQIVAAMTSAPALLAACQKAIGWCDWCHGKGYLGVTPCQACEDLRAAIALASPGPTESPTCSGMGSSEETQGG